uniref:Uncharacterized protein n=3 Tax=Caenorhabditis japonica TaxID=281687 RepID=A0A8R1ES66_CAEJA
MEASAEVDALVKSADDMRMQTEIGELNLDTMLNKAHRVAAQISSMYRYEKFLLDVQSLTVNGSRRKTILNDLQRENKQIMALQDENRQLRETTKEYLSTIREILESHAELEAGIVVQHKSKEVDDIDNIIFEMMNTSLEISLKNKAQNMQKMMTELERMKRDETNELILAAQSNKDYKDLFKLACYSSPSAARVLKTAMSGIVDEREKEHEEEDEENDDDELNQTIVRKN